MRSLDWFAARLRVDLARKADAFLLGRRGRPSFEWSVHLLRESSSDPAISERLAWSRPVLEAYVQEYSHAPGSPAWLTRVKAFEDKQVHLLRDVIVSPISGMIQLPDRRVIQDSIGGPVRAQSRWHLAERVLPVVRLDVSRPVAVAPPDGYFHWLAESLPALLFALDQCPDAIVLTHPRRPPYVDQCLEFLRNRLGTEVIVSDRPVRVRAALMAEREEFGGFVHRGIAARLRREFRMWLDEGSAQQRRKLYVSRRFNPKRRIAAEDEIEKLATGSGFVVLHAETMSFCEQVRAFASAEEIVAPHGAGLANLMWAERPIRVTELFPPMELNDCYATLARMLGHMYTWTRCAGATAGGEASPLGEIAAILSGRRAGG